MRATIRGERDEGTGEWKTCRPSGMTACTEERREASTAKAAKAMTAAVAAL